MGGGEKQMRRRGRQVRAGGRGKRNHVPAPAQCRPARVARARPQVTLGNRPQPILPQDLLAAASKVIALPPPLLPNPQHTHTAVSRPCMLPPFVRSRASAHGGERARSGGTVAGTGMQPAPRH